ncbi:Hydroxylysine Kinase [Manis pentadactyla]|nr:Hydroxylysine Kinase [Manis pentadactyla]
MTSTLTSLIYFNHTCSLEAAAGLFSVGPLTSVSYSSYVRHALPELSGPQPSKIGMWCNDHKHTYTEVHLKLHPENEEYLMVTEKTGWKHFQQMFDMGQKAVEEIWFETAKSYESGISIEVKLDCFDKSTEVFSSISAFLASVLRRVAMSVRTILEKIMFEVNIHALELSLFSQRVFCRNLPKELLQGLAGKSAVRPGILKEVGTTGLPLFLRSFYKDM